MMFFKKVMISFFFNIDKVIYGFVSQVYDLLISIARTSIISQAEIIEFSNRIYKLLAIFMIFKVTFSLITYLVNPDDFLDNNKGVGKLGFNIVISLSLLILTPYMFKYAYEFQTSILESNSMAELIFGEKTNDSFLNSAGESMTFLSMQAFFSPNISVGGSKLVNCVNLTDDDGKFNEQCLNDLYGLKNENLKVNWIDNYAAGIENSSFGLMFREDLALARTKDDEEFIMDYRYVISTVVGVLLLLLLITFCMDIALRTIKLAFLQLVAPIPIISYVDPKSGKDGLFKKWYQMCFKTYLSLFIRLLALYFALYIIKIVADGKMIDLIDGSYQANKLIAIFIIIGALMFAKQLPKILEGLGIKLDGNGFTLNPLKKFEKEALGGKGIMKGAKAAVFGGAAAGLAGATNFGSRLLSKSTWKNNEGKVTAKSILGGLGKTAGSTIAGTTSAAFRGTQKAIKGEKPGKIFASSYGEAMFAKLQREDLKRKGSTFGGRIVSDLNRFTGNLNAGQRQTLALAELDASHKMQTDRIKANREKMELGRQTMISEKTGKLERVTANRQNLSKINDRISTLKGVTAKDGSKINVKDSQEAVDNLKASGNFYAKLGELKGAGVKKQQEIQTLQQAKNKNESEKAKIEEQINFMKAAGIYYKERTIKTQDGKEKTVYDMTDSAKQLNISLQERNAEISTQEVLLATAVSEFEQNSESKYKYTEEEIQSRAMTETGKIANDVLDQEKKKALKYLRENDEEVKTRLKILEENGIHIAETGDTIKDLKLKMVEEQNSENAINAAYYSREQEFKSQEEKFKAEEKQLAEEYKQAIVEKGLDKDSLEWSANDANNAARWVKNPQQEGWKPNATVDPSSYVATPRLGGFMPPGMGGRSGGSNGHR